MSRSTTSSPIVRAAPAQRQPHGVRAGAALGPGDPPVLEHDRGTGRVHRLDRRLHDRLERLLQVERLGDGLRDAGQRLELVHAPLRLRVQLRVLDRLRHLPGDRHQQVDLGLRERARLAGADVERALELLAGEDRHGEDRRVVVLGQVRERLEARVEVRVGRDHHGSPIGGGRAGDALAAPHPRHLRRALDARAVRRAQHQLVRPLVVEVDVGRVGLERRRDLVRDRLHHLLQVERRVDDLGRAGEEREVAGGVVHRASSRGSRGRWRRGSARRS